MKRRVAFLTVIFLMLGEPTTFTVYFYFLFRSSAMPLSHEVLSFGAFSFFIRFLLTIKQKVGNPCKNRTAGK